MDKTFTHNVHISVVSDQIKYHNTLLIQGFDEQNHQILEKEYSTDDLKKIQSPVMLSPRIRSIHASGILLDTSYTLTQQLSLEFPCNILCLRKKAFGLMEIVSVTFSHTENETDA